MSTFFRPFTPVNLFKLASLSATMIAIQSPAATASDQGSKKLETVYVSATRSETAAMPVATQIKVITAEEIRLSGAKLVSEVLRTQAGIQLTDSDGSGARNVTVSMRGLSGANNVLVLVDGRKLNNASQAAPALNTVSLKDVERIEIVQGSAGVLYGDQAVGGVINIITRRATAGETRGAVSATAGSDNLEDYSASINQGFANGLSYSLSAQKRNADNYRDNNQNAYENLLANLRYDFAQGFVFVEGQDVNDLLRAPGSITDAEAEENPRQSNNPNDYSNQYTDTWRVGGGVDLSEQWTLLAEYSDRNEEVDYEYFADPTAQSLRVKSFTPRAIGEYALAHGTMVATLGYDQVETEYESDNDWAARGATQDQRSVYAQLVYPLLPKLTATLGGRYAEVEDDNYLSDVQQDDDLSASELGLNYQINSAWRSFGRFAQSFRFANPDDNGLVPVDVVFLRPQTGESVELGAQWQGDNAQVSYSLYQMQIDDEITFDPINYVNINLPDSERQGFVLDLDSQLSEQLGFGFNYTYTDAEVVTGDFKGKAVPFVAEHRANAQVVFTPVNALNLVLESVYTGSRYKADDNSNSMAKLDALVVFNLAASYRYRQWDVTARINNITDEFYAGYHSVWGQYPQPDRNYQVSVNYSF